MATGTLPPVIGEVPVSTGQPGRQPLRPDRPAVVPPSDPSGIAPPAAATLPETNALDAAVAAALGRQDGLAPVFAAAAALARSDGLSPLIARALAALQDLVLADAPDADALRAAMARSGLFYESRLAVGLPPADLKGVLLLLKGLLAGAAGPHDPAIEADPGRRLAPPPPRRGARPTAQPAAPPPDLPAAALPGHLAEAIDRSLARLLLHQAASLTDADPTPGTEADAPPALIFELPIAGPAGPSIAGIRIERDDGGRQARPSAEAGEPVYRVELAFAIAPLGPLTARVGLLPGQRVVVGLWCADAAAAERIAEETGMLSAALSAAGLEVGGIDLHVGPPPERRPARGQLPPHRLDVEL